MPVWASTFYLRTRTLRSVRGGHTEALERAGIVLRRGLPRTSGRSSCARAEVLDASKEDSHKGVAKAG